MKFSPENQMMQLFGKAASLFFTVSSFWDSYPLSSKSLYMGTFPIYLYLVWSFCLVAVDRVRWQPLIMTAKVLLILFPIFFSHLLSDHFTCSSLSPDKWATRLHSIPARLFSFSSLYPECFLAIFPPQVIVFIRWQKNPPIGDSSGWPWLEPWVGKVPWRRKWQPTPVFLPGKFYGQRSLAGYNP